MDSSLHASSITLSDFKSHLDSYPDYVPSKIQGLEELRLHEIPETLGKRRKDGDAFIEKTEAMSLLKWKLYVFPILTTYLHDKADEGTSSGNR